jgi:predicted Zn-dependent protease
MKRLFICFISVILLSCAQSPTGRDQVLLYSAGELDQMGGEAFSQMKSNTPILKERRINRYVQCIAQSLIDVIPKDEFTPAAWEVVVFDDAQVNAFALPGGYIGVYRGLLDVAENQHQLASVMGHEIAHVRAQHGNERMSQQSMAEIGTAIAMVGMQSQGVERPQDWQNAIGLGIQFGVMMPFSRSHELEADELGMVYMAKAGFDPREGVTLWGNMAKASAGSQPEWMSTHPSEVSRIDQIQSDLPHLLELRATANQSGLNPRCAR